MSGRIFFHRNPSGESLYDFISTHYLEARAYFLRLSQKPYPTDFDSDPDEQQVFEKFTGPLPPAQKVASHITAKEMECLYLGVMDYVRTFPTGMIDLQHGSLVRGLSFLQSFLKDGLPPLKMRAALEQLTHRPFTFFDDGYIGYEYSGLCGFWTSAECQEILPYLRAISQQTHPDYLSIEMQLQNYLYDLKSSREDKSALRSSVDFILLNARAAAEILLHNIEALAPHEGLIGEYLE